MVRESEIVSRIIRWLNKQPNTVARKLHGSVYAVAGDPDIYGCVNGRMFLLEVKQPGETSRPVQVLRQDEWGRAGAVVAEVHTLEEAQQAVRGLYE